VLMSHVTQMDESRHKWVSHVSLKEGLKQGVDEAVRCGDWSCHSYGCVTLQVNESCL